MINIAFTLPDNSALCRLKADGSIIGVAAAKAQGIDVRETAVRPGASGTINTARQQAQDNAIFEAAWTEKKSWADSVLQSPEGLVRPAAARKMVAAYSAASMPTTRARSFLSGLPDESIVIKATAQPVANVARLYEIRHAALRHRVSQGDHAAKAELKSFDYAARIAASTGIPFDKAAAQLNLSHK